MNQFWRVLTVTFCTWDCEVFGLFHCPILNTECKVSGSWSFPTLIWKVDILVNEFILLFQQCKHFSNSPSKINAKFSLFWMRNTSLMQSISIYFTYVQSLHVSGNTLPIIRRSIKCTKHVETEHKWNIYLLTASGWCFSFKSLYDARKNSTKIQFVYF